MTWTINVITTFQRTPGHRDGEKTVLHLLKVGIVMLTEHRYSEKELRVAR